MLTRDSSSSNDLVILDLDEGKKSLSATKERRRSYELYRHFQDSWASKLPWAEAIIGVDGSMTQVQCMIYSTINGREKLLMAKLNSLWKPTCHRRAEKDIYDSKKIKVKYGNICFPERHCPREE